jgi:predicted AAA+ superfamily ATPase
MHMPHIRSRHALLALKKKLNYSRVVAIQGVRQCGKSTLAREFVPELIKNSIYRTLDLPSVLETATSRPESFLEGLSEYRTVIIDEAQKSPVLFDTIKARVDLNAAPGQYLLLGSTEFSKGMKIREALTGRLSRLRLFPLLLSEMTPSPLANARHPFFLNEKSKISRKEFLLSLENGGMPGVFSTRNKDEWRGKLQDWISLTVERDAFQIPGKRINSAHLYRVLSEIARHPEPESGRIAKSLRLSSMTVKSLIDVLKTLFVIHAIEPHPAGSGKTRYYLCDPGICAALGGSFERQLETRFYLEILGKMSYLGMETQIQLSYYRNTKGSVVHGIWEDGKSVSLLKLLPTESVDERELFILNSLRTQFKSKPVQAFCLTGAKFPESISKTRILPWETLG